MVPSTWNMLGTIVLSVAMERGLLKEPLILTSNVKQSIPLDCSYVLDFVQMQILPFVTLWMLKLYISYMVLNRIIILLL